MCLQVNTLRKIGTSGQETPSSRGSESPWGGRAGVRGKEVRGSTLEPAPLPAALAAI